VFEGFSKYNNTEGLSVINQAFENTIDLINIDLIDLINLPLLVIQIDLRFKIPLIGQTRVKI
jgi:hypothetical protein